MEIDEKREREAFIRWISQPRQAWIADPFASIAWEAWLARARQPVRVKMVAIYTAIEETLAYMMDEAEMNDLKSSLAALGLELEP